MESNLGMAMKTIELTQGKVALVDDEDFDYLNQWNWCATSRKNRRRWYACRRDGSQMLFMHVVISGIKGADHKDNDGLNNQRNNLRPANASQNGGNRGKGVGKKTSKFKGVCWDKSKNKWMASIHFNYKGIFLGRFHKEKDAALAYDAAARKYFGEFAKTNFPL